MRGLVFVVVLVACRSQTQTSETRAAQPQSLPQAAASASTAAPSAKAPTPSRICEPTISCGRWSKCTWLEFDHADAGYDVFHIAGSDAGGYGSQYWRMHQCWPVDAGPKGCAIYCDAAGACTDAFTANGVCTVSGPPTPSPYVCEVRGTECVTKSIARP